MGRVVTVQTCILIRLVHFPICAVHPHLQTDRERPQQLLDLLIIIGRYNVQLIKHTKHSVNLNG